MKHIFHLYAFHGHTIDSLIEQLAKEGITYRPSIPRFARSSLHTLLRNRAYIGEIKYQGEWRPGGHEPLVDRETWNRVQRQLADSQYQSVDLTYAGELIECRYCGHRITGERKQKKTKRGIAEYIYYRCTWYNKGDHPRTRLNEQELDK